MTEETYLIEAGDGGRLDALVARELPVISRSRCVSLIDEGYVLLNGNPAKKSTKCVKGDLVEITLPELEEISLEPENIPLDIRFEDDDVIVVNKPRGMVVHPAPGHWSGTLVNALMYHCGSSLSGIGGEKRPGIVHRIDKDTSGLLIAAKNDFSHQALSAQLSDRSLSRIYNGIATGRMREDSGSIDKPIGRHRTDRKRMAVYPAEGPGIRSALTLWQVLERYRDYTLMVFKLQTGRTHQIRVHMQSINHPLLGDGIYGAKCPDKGLEGQCLHAKELKFIHPRSGEEIHIETELPLYFTEILEKLGGTVE